MAQLAFDSAVKADNASAWGLASDGVNTWSTADNGTATLKVVSNELQITTNATTTWAHLGTNTSADAHALVRFSLSHTTDNIFLFLRATASNTHYRFRTTNGGSIAKTIGNVTTQLAVTSTPITFTASSFYWMRAELVGNQLRLNIWADGTAESLGWLLDITDTSIAPTSAGNFGLGGGLGNVANSVSFDHFYVLDYRFAESVPVTESGLFTPTALPLDALTASDSLLATDTALPLDAITGSDLPLTLQAWGSTDALTGIESGLFTATPVPTDALVVSDSLLMTESELAVENLTSSESALFTASPTPAEALTVVSITLSTGTLLLIESNLASESLLATDTVLPIDALTIADSLPPLPSPLSILAQDTGVRAANQLTWSLASDGVSTWSSADNGSATMQVVSNELQITTNATTTWAHLGTTTTADASVRVRFKLSHTTDNAFLFVRQTAATTHYRFRTTGGGSISKVIGQVTTILGTASSPITFTANTFYWMHAEIIGSVLHMNIWLDGTAEPLEWLLEVIDTSITLPGNFGLGGGLNSIANAISFDHFLVLDYLFTERIPATESMLPTMTPLLVDALSVADTSTMVSVSTLPSNLMTFVDTLLATDGLLTTETMNIPTVLCQDTFGGGRSVFATNSFGMASDGNTWVTVTSSHGVFNVDSGEGTFYDDSVIANASATSILGTLIAQHADVSMRFSFGDTGTSQEVNLLLDFLDTNTTYAGRLTYGGMLSITKTLLGVVLTLATFPYVPTISLFYWMRFRVLYQTLFVRVWADGSTEPTTWHLQITDTAISQAGLAGIRLVASGPSYGTGITIDSFLVNNLVGNDSAPVLETPLFVGDTTPGFVEALTILDNTANGTSAMEQTLPTTISPLQFSPGGSGPGLSGQALGRDLFNRTVVSGLGIATDGQTWTEPGAAYTYSVTNPEGQATGGTGTAYAILGTLTPLDCEMLVRIAASGTNGSFGLIFRYGSTSNHYRARFLSGNFTLVKNVSGVPTTLTSLGIGTGNPPASVAFPITASLFYWIRLRVLGNSAGGTITNIWAKIWQDGTVEPNVWSVSAADATYTSGRFGIMLNDAVTTQTLTFDSFLVVDYLNSEALTIIDVPLDTTTPGIIESLVSLDIPLMTNGLARIYTLPQTESILVQQNLVPIEALNGIESLLMTQSAQGSEPYPIAETLLAMDSVVSWVESLMVTESVIEQNTSVLSEGIAVSELLSIQDGYVPGENLVVNETLTIQKSALSVEALTAVESLLGQDGYLPLDILMAVDVPAMQAWGIDALTMMDSLLAQETGIFQEGLSAQDALSGQDTAVLMEAGNGTDSLVSQDSLALIDALSSTDANAATDGTVLVEALSGSESALSQSTALFAENLPIMSSLLAMKTSAWTETSPITDSVLCSPSLIRLEGLTSTESLFIQGSLIPTESIPIQDSLLTQESYATIDANTITDLASALFSWPVDALVGSSSGTWQASYVPLDGLSGGESLTVAKLYSMTEPLLSTDSMGQSEGYQPTEVLNVLESLFKSGAYVPLETNPVSEGASVLNTLLATEQLSITDSLQGIETPSPVENLSITENMAIGIQSSTVENLGITETLLTAGPSLFTEGQTVTDGSQVTAGYIPGDTALSITDGAVIVSLFIFPSFYMTSIDVLSITESMRIQGTFTASENGTVTETFTGVSSLIPFAPQYITITWTTRNGMVTWTTRDGKATWVLETESPAWVTR
jgi:hypothetical protein